MFWKNKCKHYYKLARRISNNHVDSSTWNITTTSTALIVCIKCGKAKEISWDRWLDIESIQKVLETNQ